jgi:ABC-type uncharacterized transport system ATPase subunit
MLQHRYAKGTALPAFRTDRPVHDETGSPKFMVHEIVVQLRREFRDSEDLFLSLSSGQIRAIVGVAPDGEIQGYKLIIR